MRRSGVTRLTDPGELLSSALWPSLYTRSRVVREGREYWGTLRALVGIAGGRDVTACTAVYTVSQFYRSASSGAERRPSIHQPPEKPLTPCAPKFSSNYV